MTTIYGPKGEKIEMKTHGRPKSGKPIVRQDGFGQWAGRDAQLTLPGGGVMQFDLGRLTLADFRAMRQHYQLGASLNVLSFILHQIDWDIECENVEARDMIEQDLRENWTLLIKSMSQAFWSGYSPIAVNYKNADGYVKIDRFKDLVPEECRVKWKTHKGWAPPGKPKPTLYQYDGMFQNGTWIPPQNTIWYPLLMENGDFYGRKLLANAFPAWYFSQLIHLYANRYFERFGEPLPIGRADFTAEVELGDGTSISGKTAMENIVNNFRNRSAAVLPSDRDPVSGHYDYDLEYLESQMRGADFERYLNRLDEEMSLSVFTPVLLFRTAEVGSYNLGQAHLRIFQQMLNAIAGDMQLFIQKYLVDRLVAINFPGMKEKCRWTYRRQGQGDIDTYKELMVELVRQERAMPNIQELAAITGIGWDEVEQLTVAPDAPQSVDDNGDPIEDDDKGPTSGGPKEPKKGIVKASRATLREAADRTARAFMNGSSISLSHRNVFVRSLQQDGFSDTQAEQIARSVYTRTNMMLADIVDAGMGDDDTLNYINGVVDNALADATG